MTFLPGDGFVLYALRNDEHFTFVQRDRPITKENIEVTFDDDEGFVCIRVVMPNKFTLNFGKFEVIVIELSNDLRRPVFAELGEFFLEINLSVSHRLPVNCEE